MITLKTSILKADVSLVANGAGNNKLIPMTNLLSIKANGNVLELCTTDTQTHFMVKEVLNENDDEINIVVPVEQFSKLVSKLSSSETTMQVTDKGELEIKANGTYHIALPLDETGAPLKYTFPINMGDTLWNEEEISADTINSIVLHNKASLDNNTESCYSGYYFGEGNVLTSDGYVICGNSVDTFDTPLLLDSKVVDLMSCVKSNFKYAVRSEGICLTNDKVFIFTKEKDKKDEFQVEPISNLVDTDYPYVVRMSRADLLGSLDRLSLFVGTYDKNSITISFDNEYLTISSKKSSGVEKVMYRPDSAKIDDNNPFTFNIIIDIEKLIGQVKAQSGQDVEIHFGLDNAIKLVDGNVTQIIALMGEE